MLRVLLAVLLAASLFPVTTSAQLATVCIYADAAGSQCNITDTGAITSLYVFHTELTGATGVRYSAPVPACMTGAVWIADQNSFALTIGHSQAGVEVSYAACLTGAIHVQTILLFTQGMSQSDCPYPILPSPGFATVEVADCSSNILPAIGGTSHVNSLLPCECETAPGIPQLSVFPASVDFGDVDTTAGFNISNTGTGTLEWAVTESIPWLEASPTSGTDAGTVILTADRTGLAYGNYTGVVEVSSNGGNRNVSVSMNVVPLEPVLQYYGPTSLHFTTAQNELPVLIGNSGNADLNWNVGFDEPWLSASPTGGTVAPGPTLQTIMVSVDRSGLSDGTHTQTLHITSNGGDHDLVVSADVYTGPLLQVSPTQLSFSPGSLSSTFNILNAGLAPLTWSMSADQPWIEIVPPFSGAGETSVTVNVNPALVPPGDYVSGQVTVVSNGGVRAVEITYLRSGSTGGVIGLYADAEATSCALTDFAGLVNVYVVHTLTAGATAIQFAAPKPECMNATWLADSSPFDLVLGTSQTGTAIAYGNCFPTPVHVMTIQYLGTGTTEACCEYPVIPDPDAPTGTIEVVDCGNSRTFAHSSSGYVNPDGECPCGSPPVRVESRTWGAVKALYLPEGK